MTKLELLCWWLLFIGVVGCTVQAVDSETQEWQFAEFPSGVLLRHITASRHLPVCLVYKHIKSPSNLEEIVFDLWKKKDARRSFSQWEFGSYSVGPHTPRSLQAPSSLPTLRCHIGQTTFLDYFGKGSLGSVRKWLSRVAEKHAQQLPEATVHITGESLTRGSPYNATLIGLAHERQHYDMEEMLVRLSHRHTPHVAVFFSHPYSTSAFELRKLYDVTTTPCVVAITGDVKRSWSGHDVSEKVIDVFLKARTLGLPHLDLARFETEVLETRPLYQPIIVGFYTHWAPNVVSFLELFKVAAWDIEKAGLRSALVDAREQEILISRYMSVRTKASLPFLVLFWPERDTPTSVVRSISQHLFPWQRVSTVAVADWLRQYDVTIAGFPPWGISLSEWCPLFEGPDGTMCAGNSLNNTDNMPRPRIISSATDSKKKEKKAPLVPENERRLPKVGGLPTLSGGTWGPVIELSHAPDHPFLPGALHRGEVTKVALVIFIMAGCGSCERNMGTFRSLKDSVSYIPGGSVYLVNCSAERQLCADLRVSGFPSLTAFRGLGWLQHTGCRVGNSHAHRHTRVDYHGVLSMASVLEWFSGVAAPAVTELEFGALPRHHMSVSARLLAELIPRGSLTRDKSGEVKGREKLVPFGCFRLLCERLFGQVACYSRYSSSVPRRVFQDNADDMALVKVSMVRDDGVEADIVLAGRRLAVTLGRAGPLHTYHAPHRYDITSTQKCEDDHGACVDILTAFVLDHSRLPVTHVTSAVFHTHSNFLRREDGPVLVALAHAHNITHDSPFYKTLWSAAAELYGQLTTVTVDVDQYPGWAGAFVPRGYAASFSDLSAVPSLYHYPRLCIVRWKDHSHAAFLPEPEMSVSLRNPFVFDKDVIINFVHQYLRNPSALARETEHF